MENTITIINRKEVLEDIVMSTYAIKMKCLERNGGEDTDKDPDFVQLYGDDEVYLTSARNVKFNSPNYTSPLSVDNSMYICGISLKDSNFDFDHDEFDVFCQVIICTNYVGRTNEVIGSMKLRLEIFSDDVLTELRDKLRERFIQLLVNG